MTKGSSSRKLGLYVRSLSDTTLSTAIDVMVTELRYRHAWFEGDQRGYVIEGKRA